MRREVTDRFSLSDIAFAEGLVRAGAHLENALLLLESGRVPQALVQASRPMIELMPQLSRDLWSAPEVATELNRAVGAIAAGIRRGAQPPSLRSALATTEKMTARAIAAVVGEAHGDLAFVSSVAVALLRTSVTAAGDTGSFTRFDAVAYVRRARALCAPLIARDGRLDELFDALQARIGADEPAQAATLQPLVDPIAAHLHESAGALLSQEPDIDDYLDRIDELMGEAEAAYGAGEAFRADKLAARAYVENYAVVRQVLIAADETADRAVHDSLTGLRLGMSAKAPPEEISEVASRGRSALIALRKVI